MLWKIKLLRGGSTFKSQAKVAWHAEDVEHDIHIGSANIGSAREPRTQSLKKKI